jgi:glycosyltransferase involved in cell wall biosynthesis
LRENITLFSHFLRPHLLPPSPPESPLLSIITPAHNAAAFLPVLIRSVREAAQHVSLEWVVVDDGSTDETADLLARAGQDNFHETLRLISQAQSGVARARNVGLYAARGQYVWFVDADDSVLADALPELLKAAEATPDVIAFQAERVWPKGVDPDAPRWVNHGAKPKVTVPGPEWAAWLLTQREWRHFLWQHWYLRSHLTSRELHFKDGILHEDIAFITHAALAAASVRYVDTCAYRYTLHPASLTHSRNVARIEARISSYFTVIADLRRINATVPMSDGTRRLLEGEVVGQALQVFELARLLPPARQQEVRTACRARGFSASLFAEAHQWKRLRQVLTMWLKERGWLAIGAEKQTPEASAT